MLLVTAGLSICGAILANPSNKYLVDSNYHQASNLTHHNKDVVIAFLDSSGALTTWVIVVGV